jgi:biotin transport system substrate-specific component
MYKALLVFTPDKFTDTAIKVLLSLAILCTMSPVQWEVNTELTVNLQFGLVCFIPVVFGLRIAVISIFGYLILGGIGLPIFADFNSGWTSFTGIKAGYFFGFVLASAVIGFIADMQTNTSVAKAALFVLLGMVLIALPGLLWESGILHDYDWNLALIRLTRPLLIQAAFIVLVIMLIDRALHRKGSRTT